MILYKYPFFRIVTLGNWGFPTYSQMTGRFSAGGTSNKGPHKNSVEGAAADPLRTPNVTHDARKCDENELYALVGCVTFRDLDFNLERFVFRSYTVTNILYLALIKIHSSGMKLTLRFRVAVRRK